MLIFWGPDGILLYNQAYNNFPGNMRPDLIGMPVLKSLKKPGIYNFTKTLAARCMKGESISFVDLPIKTSKEDKSLPVCLDVDYSPIIGDNGQPAGILVVLTDRSERKKASDSRYEVNQQVNDVLESMGDAFFMLDKDWKIVRVNKNQEKVSRTQRQNTLGKVFWDVFPQTADPSTNYWVEYHNVMKTRRQSHFIERYEPLGMWTEVDVFPTRGGGITVFFRDISDRKKAENNLQQQLKITKTITDNATACLFMIDSNGLITFMNKAAEITTGYKSKKAIGQSMHKLVHHTRPDGSAYPQSDCPLVKTYKYGKPNPLHEDIFYRKNGATFPALITATPLPGLGDNRSTIVEFRDISKEKAALDTLAQSEARLRFLAESMPQKVFTANGRGEIDYFNREWIEFAGLPFKEIRDWGWTKFVHPDDVQENIRLWQESINSGKPFQFEHRFRRHDGEYRWHLSRARPMRDEDGNIIRWFGSNTDIQDIKSTQKRKDELEKVTVTLKSQKTELMDLNDAKDEFISLASHQLRTPASAVKQFLGMVLEGYVGDLTADQEALLLRAKLSNERQLLITNDLLNIAQVDAGKVTLNKKSVDLVQMIKESIEEQESKFKANQQHVVLDTLLENLYCDIDADRMRMVFENLIDNASKYTHKGKNISVKLSQTKTKAIINFMDQGVGIKKDDFSRLFHKFSRLDNPLSVMAGGSGLGLYLAKKIIDLHKGTITVDSEPGRGTTFTITLPK
ncbi:MAG: hypothetical protein NVS1B10_02110 [Candidatus Saccharimonadales bacterium]